MSKELSPDLSTLENLQKAVEDIGLDLIVTGSHAMALLTGADIAHNDIDTNVYGYGSPENIIPKISASFLLSITGFGIKVTEVPQTGNKLYYDLYYLKHDDDKSTVRRLEICVFEITEREIKSDGKGIIYKIVSNGEMVQVPTDISSIKSNNYIYSFRVKSLPYSIATWAIRCSGCAENQRRILLDRDLQHLSLLLKAGNNIDLQKIYQVMVTHPQFPPGVLAETVYLRALETLANSEF